MKQKARYAVPFFLVYCRNTRGRLMYQIDCLIPMAASSQSSSSFSRAQLLGYVSLCLIWGSTWLAIRLVVRDVPPLEAAALRFLAAGALLLGMAALQKRRWPADGSSGTPSWY